MNEEEIKKAAEIRITKLKALKNYMRAGSLEREGETEKALDAYKDALAGFMTAFNEKSLTVDDFDIIIEIVKKLSMGLETELHFKLKKKEAEEKAEWERWLYLKRKYDKD